MSRDEVAPGVPAVWRGHSKPPLRAEALSRLRAPLVGRGSLPEGTSAGVFGKGGSECDRDGIGREVYWPALLAGVEERYTDGAVVRISWA